MAKKVQDVADETVLAVSRMARELKSEMDKLEDALKLYRELQRARQQLVESAVSGDGIDDAMKRAAEVKAIAAG